MKPRKPKRPSRRNPIAASLSGRLFHARVKPPAKRYVRRAKHREN